jgi:hypothetical protein
MNRRNAYIAALVALIACLPIRLYQIFSLSDRGTGFYTDGGVTTGILSVVLAAGVLVAMFLCYRDSGAPRTYSPIHSIPTAVLGILTGLGMITEAFVSFAADAGQDHIMYMILAVFGILAGAVLILTAYDFATQQNHLERHPLLALVPPLWGCVCLVTLFITYVSVVNIADNIYNTFTVIFLLLFLFTQSKILSGVEREKSGRLIYVFGVPAALLGLVSGISDGAAFLSGTGPEGAFPTGLHLVVFLLAVYILTFLSAFHRMPVSEAAEPQAAVEESVQSEQAGSEPPVMMSEWKSCAEFLAEEYHSGIIFQEKSPSPFIVGKI